AVRVAPPRRAGDRRDRLPRDQRPRPLPAADRPAPARLARPLAQALTVEDPRKGFTEPGALSSTVPADLPTQALRPLRPIAGSGFDLLASRARCEPHPTGRDGRG